MRRPVVRVESVVSLSLRASSAASASASAASRRDRTAPIARISEVAAFQLPRSYGASPETSTAVSSAPNLRSSARSSSTRGHPAPAAACSASRAHARRPSASSARIASRTSPRTRSPLRVAASRVSDSIERLSFIGQRSAPNARYSLAR